ncbi:taurine catabolism dioxygenase [Ascobolus immersus RN42]|uniref:Taurine catabolism dioxygenase n=1 Tax=Ascobolus immersus RN42 TaxID=1160509 RepID=A0A3N4ICH1_ASCIM|nr:taurine catabolism dioxygenase [Ascobolus immersus RN42]
MVPTIDTLPVREQVTATGKQALNASSEATTTPATTAYPRPPLKLSGALDHLEFSDVTPIIGREFKNVKVTDLINAENSDALLRDLAITISQRGVVFFRNQDQLTSEELKTFVQRIGALAGKPETSKLHIHPIANAERELGGNDNEISVISSEQNRQIYRQSKEAQKDQSRAYRKGNNSAGWHSDITFEPIPSDYSTLQIVELPPTGGDTLWASGYEVYDRLSKPFQKFYESLTATYAQPGFTNAAKVNGFEIYTKERGAPENVGDELKAIHPVVRTNPVTGWKSIFAVGSHVSHINDVTERESDHILKEFVNIITRNHDLQVRFKWNKNDLAIWDNRSVYHAATPDYDFHNEKRTGNRAVSLGERPYFDPGSKSRREDLGQIREILY